MAALLLSSLFGLLDAISFSGGVGDEEQLVVSSDSSMISPLSGSC